jgi:hypothetical protein
MGLIKIKSLFVTESTVKTFFYSHYFLEFEKL